MSPRGIISSFVGAIVKVDGRRSETFGDRSRKLRYPDQVKVCSRCIGNKFLRTDFYLCKGTYRSECKACTIKRNTKNQRDSKIWRSRILDPEKQRKYSLAYYAKNKDKFAGYRRKFREKNPNYNTNYGRRKRNEKSEK